MTIVVRLAALAVAAAILVGGWLHLSADSDHDRLPRGFDSPILAIEMARSMAEVNAIVGGPGHRDRSVMRDQQHIDFAFIAAYWFLFLLIGVLLGRRRFLLAKALAFFSAACATLAAFLDVRENLAILKVLSASPAPGNDALAQAVRTSAVPKWALLFVAMAMLSFAFLGRKDWRSRSSLI